MSNIRTKDQTTVFLFIPFNFQSQTKFFGDYTTYKNNFLLNASGNVSS